jgi:hypothetical protein
MHHASASQHRQAQEKAKFGPNSQPEAAARM